MIRRAEILPTLEKLDVETSKAVFNCLDLKSLSALQQVSKSWLGSHDGWVPLLVWQIRTWDITRGVDCYWQHWQHFGDEDTEEARLPFGRAQALSELLKSKDHHDSAQKLRILAAAAVTRQCTVAMHFLRCGKISWRNALAPLSRAALLLVPICATTVDVLGWREDCWSASDISLLRDFLAACPALWLRGDKIGAWSHGHGYGPNEDEEPPEGEDIDNYVCEAFSERIMLPGRTT